jgi:hypothetical protein
VKVRIKTTPQPREIDGIKLDDMQPGTTREVSPIVGAWLVAEGYAEPEMRHTANAFSRSSASDATQIIERRRPS